MDYIAIKRYLRLIIRLFLAALVALVIICGIIQLTPWKVVQYDVWLDGKATATVLRTGFPLLGAPYRSGYLSSIVLMSPSDNYYWNFFRDVEVYAERGELPARQSDIERWSTAAIEAGGDELDLAASRTNWMLDCDFREIAERLAYWVPCFTTRTDQVDAFENALIATNGLNVPHAAWKAASVRYDVSSRPALYSTLSVAERKFLLHHSWISLRPTYLHYIRGQITAVIVVFLVMLVYAVTHIRKTLRNQSASPGPHS